MGDSSSSRATHSTNPMVRGVATGFKLINLVIGLTILALIIEWLGMSFLWSADGGHRIQNRIAAEREIVINDWSSDPSHNNALRYADDWLSRASRWLQPVENWVDTRMLMQNSRTESAVGIRKSINAFHATTLPYAAVGIDVLKGTAFRISMLLVGVPAVILFVLVALTDGLTRREVRRLSGGRESSWLYDYARRLAQPLVLTCCCVYVVWPATLHPGWGIVSASVLGSLATTVAAGRLKKYL